MVGYGVLSFIVYCSVQFLAVDHPDYQIYDARDFNSLSSQLQKFQETDTFTASGKELIDQYLVTQEIRLRNQLHFKKTRTSEHFQSHDYYQKIHHLPVFGTRYRAITSQNRLIQIDRLLVEPEARLDNLPQNLSDQQMREFIYQNLAPKWASAEILSQSEIYFPITSNDLKLAISATLKGSRPHESFSFVLAYPSGAVLLRAPNIHFFHDIGFRSFSLSDRSLPLDSPAPWRPGPQMPSAAQASYQTQNLRFYQADPLASPLGWIESNFTKGNNAWAFLDHNYDALPDVPEAELNSSNIFDFDFFPDAAPEDQWQAASVQAFLAANLFHDILYNLGFTEEFGNFQENNFGRGGVEGDAIHVWIQSGYDFIENLPQFLSNNAFFSLPNADDGSRAGVSLQVWTGPQPFRDTSFSTPVIFHELFHGVSIRLLEGELFSYLARGMAEGWSDFMGLALHSTAEDDVHGNYPIGQYLTYNFANTGYDQNYYFGARRFPYSTQLSVNPLTYADAETIEYDTNIPINPLLYPSSTSIHAMGEHWALFLWELRAELIEKLGFNIGNQTALELVVEALKLTPGHPNYLNGRDAILLADQLIYSSAHECQIWKAFAKRGAGISASQESLYENVGIIESYLIPDYCVDSADFNQDGVVDFNDLIFVLGHYGQASEFDLNQDGIMSFDELLAVLSQWTQ